MKPRPFIFVLSSVLFRLFLVLAIALMIMIKNDSMTGWYYVPAAFYLGVAIPLVGMIAFTIYLNLGPGSQRLKTVAKVISILILLITIATQIILLVDLTPNSFPFNNGYLVPIILSLFLTSTMISLAGVFANKL